MKKIRVSLKDVGEAIVTVAGLMALGITITVMTELVDINKGKVNDLAKKIDDWFKPRNG